MIDADDRHFSDDKSSRVLNMGGEGIEYSYVFGLVSLNDVSRVAMDRTVQVDVGVT